MSRGAPYRHFADKNELLAAVAAQGMRDLREAMIEAREHAPAGCDPLTRLERMIAAYVDTALASQAHYRLIFGIDLAGRGHPELAGEAAAAGVLPATAPPLGLAALLLATTHGLVDLLASRHGLPEKGLDNPSELIRLLLTSMGHTDRG